ncbi:Nucleic acid-binding, OB-fold containing protein [Parasponia andersonii]|uniref:Nucleic acid-binding, OB-fold containing protein n=1 Tax=Parasponia andersonii TaxID=3476 RepID=A0A2P5BAY5_PARAD|nr:Nucleic acid-binding, OB-fold containing protein [Parasponia andersonii]
MLQVTMLGNCCIENSLKLLFWINKIKYGKSESKVVSLEGLLQQVLWKVNVREENAYARGQSKLPTESTTYFNFQNTQHAFKGTKIRASIYSNNIPAFEHKLQKTKTYLLSNATVKDAKAEFRQRDDGLHWTINAKTTLQEIYENHDDVLQSVYNFTPFTEIQNVLTAVIDIRPQRKVQTPISGESIIQELILEDKLTTENTSHLDIMINTKEYLDSAIPLQHPSLDQIVPIITINDMLLTAIEKASFKSFFKLPDKKEKIVYRKTS